MCVTERCTADQLTHNRQTNPRAPRNKEGAIFKHQTLNACELLYCTGESVGHWPAGRYGPWDSLEV